MPPVSTKSWFRMSRILPWLVLFFSLTITYHLWKIERDANLSRLHSNFDFQVRENNIKINQRLLTYEQILRGAQGLFAASGRVTRYDFHRYVDHQYLEKDYPGTQAIGFTVIVPPAQKKAHIAAVNKELSGKNYPIYTIKPEGERSLYTSILYLEPFSGRNLQAFGYDAYSDPVRRTAMDRARDSGDVSITDKITLVQETAKDVQAGFLMFLPIYKNGAPHNTLAERRTNLIGWVNEVFRMNDLMRGIQGEKVREVGYAIYDSDRVSINTLMYDSDSLIVRAKKSRFQASVGIDFGGHHWTELVSSYPELEELRDMHRTTLIAEGGAVVSLLIALLTWLLMTDRVRALTLAQKMTLELAQNERVLKQENEKNIALLRNASDGIHILDPAGNVVEASDSFCAMLGYQRNEMIGMNVSQWDAEMSSDELVQALNQLFSKKQHVLFQTRHRRKDGSIFNVEISSFPLELDGQPVLFNSSRDITDRKSMEQTLRIAATAFEVGEGMMITDAKSVILRVNDTFTTITGFTAEEVIGKTPHILNSGRHGAPFYAEMWGAINTTGSWGGEIWNKRKNDEVYPEHLTITAVKNKDGDITNYVATLTDITTNKKAADEITNLAFYDPLTQLPNRRLLHDRLFQALSSSDRSGQAGALLFIDLDNFKIINDTLGHAWGDIMLQKVAERLKLCVREGDTVARLGGDEFVLILENLSRHPIESAAQAGVIGEKILAALNRPYLLGTQNYFNSPSIGITLFNGHEHSADELFKQSDIAMYQAKDDGRNTMRFFDPKMQEVIHTRSTLESELRNAVESHQLFLYYQIQMDYLQNPIGAEALIRWIHPERGLVSPADFIPIAEETGLIIAMGQWVLEEACFQLKNWEQDKLTRDLVLSVNVSAKQFRQTDFVGKVKAAIQLHGANPKRLKLELTESLLLDDVASVIVKMQAITEFGIRFSLDDFGTGYSSLQYLKRLPLHQLKIDQSFVRDLVNHSDNAIVDTIISMAHSLNLDVIAEGVETEEQRLYLENAGCPHYQGYLFSKPVPLKEFEALVKKYHDESMLYSFARIQPLEFSQQIETEPAPAPALADEADNESLEIFSWNESFSTGIFQIDEQHKQLVYLINVLAAGIASKAKMPALDKIFNELVEYAVYHFKMEEAIWHDYLEGDALETSHNHVHESFIVEVTRLKGAAGAKTQNEMVENILSFLTNWLVFHILDSDKRMAMVVIAMQSGLSLEKAKQNVTRAPSHSMKALIGANLSMYNKLSRRTFQLMKEVHERKSLAEKLLKLNEVTIAEKCPPLGQ